MFIQENFRRATAELVVLHLLLEEDLYGYRIVQKIKESSDMLYTIPEGTLYPVMYRLISKGFISEFNCMVEKRMRKYYRLEESGRAYYQEILCDYITMTKGIFKILDLREEDNENE